MIRREDAGPLLTAAGLGAWLWACIGSNHLVPGFDRLHETAGGLDVWLPRWRFFAPEPVSSDVVLRYQLDGQGWQEMPVGRPGTWAALLVNPGRRRRKALSQVGRAVGRRATAHDVGALRSDWQHRLLVAHVIAELRRSNLDRGAATMRFAVVEDPGHDLHRRVRILYESGEVRL